MGILIILWGLVIVFLLKREGERERDGLLIEGERCGIIILGLVNHLYEQQI